MEKISVNLEKLYYGFPVVLISFYDQNGVPNVTTVSSTYTLKNMMMVGLSSKGFAAQQIKEVKDFVINLPMRTMEQEIGICGSHSGRVANKFDLAMLTPVKSSIVNAPIIGECPIAIECTLKDVIESDHFGGLTNLMAEIKGRSADEGYLSAEGGLELSRLDPIHYYGDGKTKGFKFTL